MTVTGWLQILAFCALLIILAPILGRYMAKVYSGERVFLTPVFGGGIMLYVVLRTASIQPWNNYAGVEFHAAPWDVTFNTVSSFLTNTNWQYYGGETTLTYLSQMLGL